MTVCKHVPFVKKVTVALVKNYYYSLIKCYWLMKKVKLFFTAVAVLLGTVLGYAQDIRVTGTVKDHFGEPIPGAAVILSGTTRGVNTELDGSFVISAPGNGTLVVSIIGYQEQKVEIKGQTYLQIVMSEDTEFLDDVIVVAYGTSTKSSFTGSAAMVKEDAIEKKISTNVTSALAGTAPGVQLISSSGDPTSNSSSIRIRGIGSMSASSAPLVVVDGVPYEGAISDINPADVESMSVLKDASSSAIYGHRGANGVILITTKKGKAGDAQVRIDAKVGVNSRLIPQYDVITDPAQYYEVWYKRMYDSYLYSGHTVAESYAYADKYFLSNEGGLGYQIYTVPEGEKIIGKNFKLNPNATLGYTDGTYYYTPDNWYDEAFHNSVRQEYNMSVSGSSDRFNYYASAAYLDDKGVVNNSAYKRFTGRLNAEYQAKKWFRMITNMSFSHSDSQKASYSTDYGSSGNIFYIANNIAPIYPLYVRDAEGNIMKENGRVIYDANQTGFVRPSFVGNAVRDNEYNRVKSFADVLTGKWGAVLTPVAGLTLSANVGLTVDNTRGSSLYSPFGSSANVDGGVSVSHSRMFTVNQQYLAEYKKSFGDHSIDILAGYEQYNYTSQKLSGYNDHLFNPEVGELNNADGTSARETSSYTNKYMTEGFLARAQYDYAGKYFASASWRHDASSRFAKGHRWGDFGSIGAAWLISQEDFMSGADWVNMLKLKVSYGVQGNDDLLSFYPYADQYTHSYNEDSGEYSLKLSYKGNEQLTWETSKSFNVGVDFELFNNYLNGTFEVFNRVTDDLLYSKSVPLSAGNPTGVVPVNVGSIRNAGFELALDGGIIRSKNVDWTWNANFSHYKNTILSLDESVENGGIKGSNYIYKIGGSLYEAYMKKFAGVNKETGKAQYWTLDDEGNDVITEDFGKAVQYECGSVLPKLYGGFGTSVSFFGFDFSVQLSYQLGGKYYDGTYQAFMQTQSSPGQNIHKDILNAWTPENTNTNVPRFDGDVSVGQTAVDRFLVSSNYLSINNVTLGYTFPANLVKHIKLSSARIFVAGENLFVFSARKGIDPRFSMGLGSYSSGAGLNSGNYSAMRNITGGITITF